MDIFTIEGSNKCLIQFSQDGVGEIVADVFNSLDLGGFICRGLVVVEQVHENAGSGDQIVGNLREHGEEGSVSGDNAHHLIRGTPAPGLILFLVFQYWKTGHYLTHYQASQWEGTKAELRFRCRTPRVMLRGVGVRVRRIIDGCE